MNTLQKQIGVLALAGYPFHSALALTSDNFNDNLRGPEWSYLQDSASLSLNETNSRLELTANAPTSPNFDALYLSNGPTGFLLDTSADFNVSIGYNFTAATIAAGGSPGNALALVFGVGRDLPDGTDSAAIGFGYANAGTPVSQLVGSSRTDDISSSLTLLPGGTTSGAFRISYSAAGDDLTLGVDGNASTYALNDTVKAIWGASSLYVSFGARGNGFNVSGSNAYLDNFSVNSGTLLPVPEPSTKVFFVLGGILGVLWIRQRARVFGL